MAQELITYIWCDNHPEDEKVPGRTIDIPFGPKPMTLDLCEPCEKELLEPVRVLLEEHGAPIKAFKTAKNQGKAVNYDRVQQACTECDQILYSKSGLRRHLREQHGIRPKPSRDYGGPFPCPECGEEFHSPQGVGVHRAKLHDYISPARQQAEAKEQAELDLEAS